MELWAVREHQREGLPAPEAKRSKSAGKRVDTSAKLTPGDREGVFLRTDRDLVLAVRRRDAEGLRKGRGSSRGARGRSSRSATDCSLHSTLLPLIRPLHAPRRAPSLRPDHRPFLAG